MPNQLTTKINKPELATLCADAISEIERAVRLFPTWPAKITLANLESVQAELMVMRAFNGGKKATAVTIFGEEFFEFLESAMKPGNHDAARIELVQALAMLLRIGCHLNDYIPHRGTESTEAKQTFVAPPVCPLDQERSRAASVKHRAVGPHIKNSFLGPALRGVLVTDDEGRKVMMQP